MQPKYPQVYLGFDPREERAYDVARHSIQSRTSGPINIFPLRLQHLGMLKREIVMQDGKMWDPVSNAPMSTEFAISRFCIPFLQHEGWALFADCDIVCWEDIRNLFALADDKYAVMVVKHKQETGDAVKMDGQVQTFYSRKNWSSVVLWNCSHPAHEKLTEERLNTWPGRYLHAFNWLEDDQIGELPQEWNFLVGVTPGKPFKRGIWHYTLGGPWFEGTDWSEENENWLDEENRLKGVFQCS